MTIWVPGEGDQGMAGVTIAARDTLRYCALFILTKGGSDESGCTSPMTKGNPEVRGHVQPNLF